MTFFLLFTRALAVDTPLDISKDGTICYGLLDKSYSGPLVIPEGVKIIWKDSFAGETKLTSLKLPQSLKEIQEKAFFSCSRLTGSLIIPDSVTVIGDYAFCYCRGFNETLTLGESVAKIGIQVFYGCTGFTGALIFPDSVSDLGSYTFTNCNSLTEVHFGRQITQIPSGTFQRCSLLKRCFFYNPKVTIQSSAFTQCPDLQYFIEVNRCQYFVIQPRAFSEGPISSNFICLDSPPPTPSPSPTSLFSEAMVKYNPRLISLLEAGLLVSG